MRCCDDCTLRGPQPVSGWGNPNQPQVMAIGEAPGKEEDQQSKSFVGQSGQLLRRLVKHYGLNTDSIYYTNVCKCRPMENRTPTAKEIDCCLPDLLREISDINPQFILALGATAGRALFPDFKGVHKSRGHLMQTVCINGETYPGMVSLHPAICLHRGKDQMFMDIATDIRKASWLINGHYDDAEHITGTTVVESHGTAKQAIDILKHADTVAYDWETTGLDPNRDEGFCLSLSHEPQQAIVFPVHWVREYREELSEIFNNEDITIVAFNTIFDAGFNRREGLPPIVDEDPMYIHYMLDERKQQRSLEKLSSDFLMAPPYESQMLAEYETDKKNMIRDVPREVIYEYAGKDADYCLRLYNLLYPELERHPRLLQVYRKILLPSAIFLEKVKRHGILIDQERLYRLSLNLMNDIQTSKDILRDMTDPGFNPNSHPQVHEVLWDELGLKEPKIPKRKPRSADTASREALMNDLPNNSRGYKFVSTLHEYKLRYHQLSRYIRKLPDFIQEDGRIRPSFHLDRTETGRLSATDPPIQQWPKEDTFRSLVKAAPDYRLIKADYSQVEMRMAALYGRDEKLAEMLRSDDFHTSMASRAFGVSVDRVTKEMRDAAKAVSFGLLYGMHEKQLAANTGLSPEDAQQFVEDYKALMPGVQRWIKRVKGDVQRKGFVESLFGRRRRFPLITKQNLDDLFREAVNFPIQSAASDLALIMSRKLQERIDRHGYDAHIIILMHDEVVIEAHKDQIDDLVVLVRETMEDVPFETEGLGVPFPIDIDVGSNWSVT